MESTFQRFKIQPAKREIPMGKFKQSLLGLFSAMLFFACGDDVTKVTEVTQEISGLEVVSSADSLGKCTEESSGKMRFASKENAVYVCSDSVWQNFSATKSASCSTELLSDGSGYKIVCGGNSVGVILSGKDGLDGKDGADGANGEDGKDGSSCVVSLLSDGSGYKVLCGGDSVGVFLGGKDGLNGEDGAACSLTDNGDGSVTQVCGGETVTLYKAFCGGIAYDPDSSLCYEGSVYALLCGGTRYSPAKNFCFADSLYSLCGGERFDPETKICYENSLYEKKCAGEIYDPSRQECFENRLFETVKDDRDGQIYRIVEIGSQIWMAENLNYDAGVSLSFCHDNVLANCKKYGRLYTWSAAMEVCPDGWHLPDTTE